MVLDLHDGMGSKGSPLGGVQGQSPWWGSGGKAPLAVTDESSLPMITHLLVSAETSLHEVLNKINGNGLGIAIVIDDDKRLAGMVTDGDVRRGLLEGATLGDSVSGIMTRECVSLPVSADRVTIMNCLDDPRIALIPLLDDDRRPVDFASLRRLHSIPVAEPNLAGNELDYVTACLRDNWISSQGPFVRRFESEFARYLGVPQALSTCNGTAALHLALTALGIGPGDEVIVPDLTFAASINAILYCGATPVLVDVDRLTWNIDPDEARLAISPRTRAIMVVHLYGQAAEMGALAELARTHGLSLIEDAAEALGATYQGQPIGTFGDAAAFSFFGNKLITTGEGGMLVMRDPEAAARARILRDHGMAPERRYWHNMIGYNYRLTNLQAAIGVAQLERIDQFIARKLELAAHYSRHLSEIPELVLPVTRAGSRNVYWIYSVIVDGDKFPVTRELLMDKLRLVGIETRFLFYPLHHMPCYTRYGAGRQFPNTEWLSKSGISLPSSVNITVNEVNYICKEIHRALIAP